MAAFDGWDGVFSRTAVPYALYSGKSKSIYVQAFQPESGITDTERLVYKPVPQVQVTVPESGTYLILANLGGSATTGDSGLSGFVRKLIPGGTMEMFDFRIHGKPQGQAGPGAESSGWSVTTLNANDVLRLDYQMGSWVTPNDSSPFSVNRGKLMLVKLN